MSRIRAKNEEIIIRAASQVFAEHGYAATKTATIAQLADLPKPNIYYYFGSKEKLYRAVLESITEPLLAASEPFIQHQDPVLALTAYIKSKLMISKNYPYASKVFANEIMHGAPHLPPDIIERLSEQTRTLSAKLNDWIAQNLLHAVDAHHLLFAIWASTQTYADFNWQITMTLGKEELDDHDFELAAQQITQLVLSGCNVQALSY
ncbi:TetR/AcrR family transcriptional regulator [Oceanisphaera pacifica]|uniref:TetR family transcriptional regulator C-terminal domain-containing protein n=1 Tax=Oceanisphaera pacifica TaxID=2818389 RepID=A0ABS3NCF4_9GAMM|nr:TetR/AcrR family transcriptional regulator [Oceanisphaera pacifica]MBO1518274.1 TetR family transcriptional regulator C-terminal domain-containing protein [Oceanisphaera pacifica]